MALPICHDSSDLWKVERANGIGGSDAPQILGLSSFGGPARVAASKLGITVEDYESEMAEWGRYVEEPMIRRFAAETGIEGAISGYLFRSQDPATPWLQATIDGVLRDSSERAGIQCKMTIYKAEDWLEGVPDYVNAQVQHEIATMEWDYAYVLVLLRGYQFRWARVERDQPFIDDVLLPAEAEFWHRLKAGDPIAPLGAPDAEWAALRAMFPRPVPGKAVHLPGPQWVDLCAAWRASAEEKTAAEKRTKELRNQLVAAIGDAEAATLDDGTRLTFKLQTRKAYHVEESSTRVLRVGPSK
jgi:putative phage-type endonuclease